MDISRRDFLKIVGAAGAVASVGVGLSLPDGKVFAQQDAANVKSGTETLFGYCKMCMKGDCSTLVTVENGIVTEIVGNPDSPINKGTLCPRGKSAILNLYNPYRVKAPMKRTNPKKGLDEDPGWVEISWEEAIEIVGSKFKEIRDNDPRELVYNVGFGMMDYFVTFFPMFAMAYGTPNLITSNGPLCAVHYAACLIQASMPVSVPDLEHGKYLISLGRTTGPNFGAANSTCRALPEAMENGLELVVVDPRCSIEASKGTWVPIRPGTDLSFVLALINVVLYEIGRLDFDFLKNRSNASYLIQEDGDYYRGASGKPQIWDLADGRMKDFDDPSLKDPALEGEYFAGDNRLTPSFILVKEAMENYSPEWAEEICTIPAATIRKIASDFVEKAMIGSTIKIDGFTFPYRPVGIVASRGALNHEDGAYTDLACRILCELVGAMDVPGGNQGCHYGPHVLEPTEDGTVAPIMEAIGEPFSYPPNHFDLCEYFPHRHSTVYSAYRTMLEPEKYGLEIKPKGLFVVGGNSVIGVVEPKMVAESISKVPFTASIVYHFDEIAQLSDVIMPEYSMLERFGINTTSCDFLTHNRDTMGATITMVRQPVEPIYNTRLAQDIAIDILERVGALSDLNAILNQVVMLGETTEASLKPEYQLELNKKYEIGEIWDRALKSYYGDEYGVDYLHNNGIIIDKVPAKESYNYFHFPGSETRYQFYIHTQMKSGQRLAENIRANNAKVPGWEVEDLLEYYQPIPVWRKTHIFKAPEEFDLFALNYKIPTSMFRLGSADQMPWTMDWNTDYHPYFNVIGLNAATAEKKGFRDGDIIVVESLYGKIEGKVKTSQLFHPDSVAIAGATGRMVKSLGKRASELVHFNVLLGAPFGNFDPVMGAVECTPRVKVYKV
ncbi:MAG TPA: molybdopterin-dependent oxidoreductase [Syntrophomonadaceae bacterium]|nr:molybdopterin-dependent oxidoreductase [Syntrophomonadaceae bacterium]